MSLEKIRAALAVAGVEVRGSRIKRSDVDKAIRILSQTSCLGWSETDDAPDVVTADFKTAQKAFLSQGIEESLVKESLDLFKTLKAKNKLSAGEKNIDLWAKKKFVDFKERMDELALEKTKNEKRKGAIELHKSVEDAKKIAENEDWAIYHITSNIAAAELGQGTEWCIRFNPSDNYENYAASNNIYYLISKNLTSEDPWAKIAFLIGKDGDTSYWDAYNKEHKSVPSTLNIPAFKSEKPSIWKPGGKDIGRKDINVIGLNLKTLEGAPKEVGGNFYCSVNNLESLLGAPEKVGGDFTCYNNKLKTLEGAPKEVGGSFLCHRNNLESLIGAPREVGGSFLCHRNNLESLIGAPEKVGEDFYCGNNSKEFTEDEVRAVCRVKGKVHV